MSAELGAQAGLIAPDETTRSGWPPRRAGRRHRPGDSDADAPGCAHHRFDAARWRRRWRRRTARPTRRPVDEFARTRIDVAYIGACTGAKLDDLRAAATVCEGNRADVQLLVAPASLRDQQTAEHEGMLQILLDAGAQLLPNACGVCAGYGEHLLPEDAVAISSTARNFKGRMGAAIAQVYLGSPYTVAASAVRADASADPRELLQ